MVQSEAEPGIPMIPEPQAATRDLVLYLRTVLIGRADYLGYIPSAVFAATRAELKSASLARKG